MKRALLILSILICLCTIISCDHSHSAKSELLSDEEYHWYPCVMKDCDEMLEKARHEWDAGEITTEPTSTQDGVISYICKACKKLKQEPVKYKPSPEVDEATWKSAFTLSNFTNVTTVIEEEIKGSTAHKTVYRIESAGMVVYVQTTVYENDVEKSYSAKFQDGNFLWLLNDKNQKIEDVSPELILDPMDPAAVLTGNGFDFLKDCFDKFTYDSENECYVASNIMVEGMRYGLKTVSVKVGDNRILEICATTDENPELNIKVTYSNYGKTEPTPPTREENN